MEARDLNRVGALALRVCDAMDAAVPAPDGVALLALYGFAEGRPLGLLQQALGLSQPGAAHLASRLERDGMVRRRPDPGDGRVTTLALTARGRRAAQGLEQARLDAIAAVLGDLPGRDADRLARLAARALEQGTTGRAHAARTCRACAVETCGHPDCPVTQGANRAEALAASADG